MEKSSCSARQLSTDQTILLVRETVDDMAFLRCKKCPVYFQTRGNMRMQSASLVEKLPMPYVPIELVLKADQVDCENSIRLTLGN